MDTDRILAEAELGAAVELAIVDMQQATGCDRKMAKIILTVISREKEKAVSNLLHIGANEGMDPLINAIGKEIRSQIYIQTAIAKIDL